MKIFDFPPRLRNKIKVIRMNLEQKKEAIEYRLKMRDSLYKGGDD